MYRKQIGIFCKRNGIGVLAMESLNGIGVLAMESLNGILLFSKHALVK